MATGTVALTGTLDIKDIEKAVESLETKVEKATTEMGNSIEKLTAKMKENLGGIGIVVSEINKGIKTVAFDTMAGGATNASEKVKAAEGSLNDFLAKEKALKTELANGKITTDQYASGMTELYSTLGKAEAAATALGKSLSTVNKFETNTTTSSLASSIRTDAKSVSSETLSGYNIPSLQQANALVTQIIEKEGVSKKQQQELIDLRGRINTALKQSKMTTEEIAAAGEKIKKININEALDLEGGSISANTAAIKVLKQELTNLNDPLGKNKDRAKELRDKIAQLSKENAKAAGTTVGLNTSLGKLQAGFQNLMTRMAFYLSIGALTGFAKQLIEVRGEFEKTTIALGAIIKDFDEANNIFLETQQLALKSPFTIMELTTSTKQLAAYNVGMEDLVGTTQMLADLSAGVGTEMQRLVVNYGQIKALGVANNRELKDFAVAGLPVYEELANRFTELEGRMVSAGEVFERVSNRMVSFEDVQAVLENLTSEGGRFYNIQEEMSKSLAGRLSNLTDAYQLMYNEIGESSTGVLNTGIDLLRWFAENWKEVARAITVAGAAMATMGITNFIVKIRSLNRLVKLLTVSLWKLWKVVGKSPWGVALGAIAALATYFMTAEDEAVSLKDTLAALAAEGAQAADNLVSQFKGLTDVLNDNTASAEDQKKAYDKIKQVYGDILPSQSLEIQNLRNQTDGYNALTVAIRENINARTLENQIGEIRSAFADKIASQTQTATSILAGALGGDTGAATRVLSALMEQGNELSVTVFNAKETAKDLAVTGIKSLNPVALYMAKETLSLKNTVKVTGESLERFREIVKQQAGVDLSFEQAHDILIGGGATALNKLISAYASMNSQITTLETNFKQNNISLGRLTNSWNSATEAAEKYVKEQKRIRAEAIRTNEILTEGTQDEIDALKARDPNAKVVAIETEVAFEQRVALGELNKYVDSVNQSLKSEGAGFNIDANTNIYSPEIKAQLSNLDEDTRLIIQNLLDEFKDIQASKYPKAVSTTIIGTFERVIGSIKGATVTLDTFKYNLKKPDTTFGDYLKTLGNAAATAEMQLALMNVRLKETEDPTVIAQLKKEIALQSQKATVLRGVADAYAFPTEPKGGTTTTTDKTLSNQLSIIKNITDQYREWSVLIGEADAKTQILAGQGDVFAKLFKGTGLNINDLLTFDDTEIEEFLTKLESSVKPEDMDAFKAFSSELRVTILTDVAATDIANTQREIDSLFHQYNVGVNIEAMGEYGSLMSEIFDTQGIDLSTLENELTRVTEEASAKTQQWEEQISEAKAVLLTDPDNESAKSTIANLTAEVNKNSELIADKEVKLDKIREDNFNSQISRYKKLSDEYSTIEQKILNVTAQIEQNKSTAEVAGSANIGGSIVADLSEGLSSGEIKATELTKEQAKAVFSYDLLKLTGQDLVALLEQYTSTAYENTKVYAKLAMDLGLQSTRQLKNLVDESTRILKDTVVREQGSDGKFTYTITTESEDGELKTITLTAKQYEKALKDIREVESEIRSRSPWKEIADQLKKDEDGLRNWEGAIQSIGDEFSKLSELTSAVGGVADILGADDRTSEIIGDIGNTLAGAGETASGVSKLMSGDIIGGITSIVSGINSIWSTWADNSDNEILRQITESEDALKNLESQSTRLETQYTELERAIDDSLGSAAVAAKKAAIAQQELIKQNLILQKQELEKQLAYQKSRDLKEGSDDDDTRDDAVSDLENAITSLNSEISDLAYDIEQNTKDIVNDLLGSTTELATNLASTWLDMYRSGDDALSALKDSFADTMNDMLVNAVLAQAIESEVAKIWSKVQSALEDNAIDSDEWLDIEDAIDTGSSVMDSILQGLADRYGVSYGDQNADNLSTLQKGIQGITETQAGALEALWTTSVSYQLQQVNNQLAHLSIASSHLMVANNIYNAILAGNATRNEMRDLMKKCMGIEATEPVLVKMI